MSPKTNLDEFSRELGAKAEALVSAGDKKKFVYAVLAAKEAVPSSLVRELERDENRAPSRSRLIPRNVLVLLAIRLPRCPL